MKIPIQISLILCLICFLSCQKNWLEAKPDNRLVVLSSVEEYQSLMDNSLLQITSGLGEAGSDDYYVDSLTFPYLNLPAINLYLWAIPGYGAIGEADWTELYQGIFSCNTAITGLSNIQATNGNTTAINEVYGAALYHRGVAYYELAQTFMNQYDSATANTDLGLPLRLEADITVKTGRATVQQTYDQILSDLHKSVNLLPTAQSQYRTRANKSAAYAELARVYLCLRDYKNALSYSDSCLQINNTLIDFNVYAATSNKLPHFDSNPEVLVYSTYYSDNTNVYNAQIDTVLYNSYDSNDLRKTLYFTNSMNYTGAPGISFRGSYDGYSLNNLFSSPAVDEVYLINAECKARLNLIPEAMAQLNTLLAFRKSGTFIALKANDQLTALQLILGERRKELVMRGTRWTDLRRLNLDVRFATNITRLYNGLKYQLPAKDKKYVWPIPDDEILQSGIPQNPR